PPLNIRRWRLPAAIGAALLLTATLGLLVSRPESIAPLDPKNPGPQGAQALARILDQRGVQVGYPDSFSELQESLDPTQSTVLIARPDLLATARGPDLARLLRHKTADLVIIAPDNALLAELGLPVGRRELGRVRDTAPQCDLPVAQRAGTITTGGGGLPAVGTGPQSRWRRTGCYPQDGVSTLVQLQGPSGQRITLLGSGAALTNSALSDEGNAALAIGLLGRTPRLLWWTPDPLDVPARASSESGPPDVLGLLPAGVSQALLFLLPLLASCMFWRGRRLGRLSTEPLPVTVRAIETTLGRATLYRRTRARGRAAQILRAASVRRLAIRFGLPRTSDPQAVAPAVADALGREERAILDLIVGPDPTTDADL
ncbi:MAG: DUF4350 domain-containing protein, partial [Angustibacter sp.]